MKIAFIGQKGIFGKSGGGVETHVEDLALHLAKEGNEVLVYVRSYYCRLKFESTRKYKGVTLVKLPTVKTKHLDAITHTFFSSIDVLRRDVDIIHYQSIGPALLLWVPKFFKRHARVVFTFHSQDYYHKKWGKFAKLCLKIGEWVGCHLADEVIAVSKSIKEYIHQSYGITANFIPNGVRAPRITESSLIKKWGLEKNNYILYVARMIPHKNIHLLLGAYQELSIKHVDKKLVVVGGGMYTDLYVKYLKSYSKNNKNIIFTGELPSNSRVLQELYSNAYLYVHPSESEGLSISILEAGSFGLPVLVSDIRENRDVIEQNGFYFKNKDPRDLRDKMEYLLNHRGVLILKKRLLQRSVATLYDWKILTKKITHVYLTAHKGHVGNKPDFHKVIQVK